MHFEHLLPVSCQATGPKIRNYHRFIEFVGTHQVVFGSLERRAKHMSVHLVQVPEPLLETGAWEPIRQQSQAWEGVEKVSSGNNGIGEGGHESFRVGDETLVGFDVVESISHSHDDGAESAKTKVSTDSLNCKVNMNPQSNVVPEFLGVFCESAEEVDRLLLHDRVVLNDSIMIQVLVEHASVMSPFWAIVHHGKAVAEINAEDH